MAARGPSGEDLTIDIGWLGSGSPQHALVHSSGIHGVEGFAGSAIQLQLLEEPPKLPPDTAVLFTHILNPFGMAWLRRANENNVDLNRNFIPDGHYEGIPPHYEAIDTHLSRGPLYTRAITAFMRYGVSISLQAVAGGQYEFPQNLFYGGKQLEPGLEKYYAFLKQNLASARRALGIDVHTGIGRFSRDLLIVERDYDSLRQIFGSHVTLSQPKHLPAYRIRGSHHELFISALSHAQPRFLMQEFGTYNPVKVFRALREENQSHHNGAALDHVTKETLKETFCPTSETWRQRVLLRGQEVFDQALQELGTLRN